jgi:hypothetical protein
MKLHRPFRWLAGLVLLGAAVPACAAGVSRTLCVFDILGANGDVYQLMKQYAVAAQQWGVDFQLKPYTDESTARDDFKAGKCDAAEITGIRNRGLVKFAGSLDMMAALPTYSDLHTAIAAISSPKAAPYMREGDYETVGVAPLGAAYLFGHSREHLADWKKLAGSTISVMSYDQQAIQMVRFVGGSVVPATISTFASMFNNGSVQLCYAPAFAYSALELYKGLGKNGGILRYNLGILTAQIDIHYKQFPTGFGDKSRAWVYQNLWDPAMRVIKKAEANIPARYWVDLDAKQKANYQQMFAGVREKLWKANVYSHRMQTLLKRIRCRSNPSDPECSTNMEGPPSSG